MGKFTYKNLCWSFGTTSFRTKNLNRTIEEQLKYLDLSWLSKENYNEEWKSNEEVQVRYYELLLRNKFISGDAPNKAKDAREKTSGLVDLGLIDDNRRLTEVGKILLDYSTRNDFSSDNFLNIPKDSFIYLKQLLKLSYEINGEIIRPFVVFIKLLLEHEYLSYDEFIYLVPLCTSEENTKFICSKITNIRNHKTTFDEVLEDYIMSFENYKTALDYFQNNEVTQDVILDIGMNRKSRNYDIPYFNLYEIIRDIYLNKKDRYLDLLEAIDKLKLSRFWKSYFFSIPLTTKIKKNPKEYLNSVEFNNVKTIEEFKTVFFKTLHLFKVKSTLFDYHDLNRRYIKTTDIVSFKDDTVKLDILAFGYFSNCIDSLYANAFNPSSDLFNNIELNQITNYTFSEKTLLSTLSSSLNLNLSSIKEAQEIRDNQRMIRFNQIVNEKYSDSQLVKLLTYFEERKDDEIKKYINCEAEIPTIFEYVNGIIWFKISGRKFTNLNFFNMSLDADLLPKSHANGGKADIIFNYSKSDSYPSHNLLIEVTLTNSTNQRRAEMEPVSRHLGFHLLETKNANDYAVFITSYLDFNVISDFRARKYSYFYNPVDRYEYVTGMKIIPLATSELKEILTNKLTYEDLYKIFDAAFNSSLPPHDWYDKEIKNKLEK